jgi:hypothetical protein
VPGSRLAVFLQILFPLVVAPASAWAETVNCTPITAVPAVITVQGVYCLTGNLITSIATGSVIEIQTNNVALDLNGFKIGGLAAGTGTSAFGIHAANRQNITIRNGTIRGFRQAIALEDAGASQGHLVENIRADQNTEVGIQVGGSGNIVRNNQVVATGGTTLFGPDKNTYGIYVSGTGPRVLNNDVIDTVHVGAASSVAIYFASVTGGLAVDNRITSADFGVYFSGGTGKYRDNLTSGVVTPYGGGTSAGNNF